MRFRAPIAICFFSLAWATFGFGQARTLSTDSPHPVALPAAPGRSVILASVRLGPPRLFSMFNLQAAGDISPDPDMSGAEFDLLFVVCDQADCRGAVRTPVRILPDEDARHGTAVVATRSFSVRTHSTAPVDLSGFQPRNGNTDLYLAVALRVVREPSTTPFTAQVNLLRVDVLP